MSGRSRAPSADEPTESGRASLEDRAERLSHAIYGTIIVTALLVTLRAHDDSAEEVLAALLGTGLVLFVAHVYATALARRVTQMRRPVHHQAASILLNNLPVLLAVVVPAVVFVFALTGAISLAVAYWIAIGYALASLFVFGLVYGLRTEHSLVTSVVIGIVSGGLGAAITLLELAIE